MVSALDSLKSSLDSTLNSSSSGNLKSGFEGLLKFANAAKTALNIGGTILTIKKGWSIIKDISTEYIDMIETTNLFEVSMGKVVDEYGNLDEASSEYYIKALEFQEEMNEKLGTNMAELQEYQAMYYSMLKSQGIGEDYAYSMSENLTKAGYDIASLYNLDVDEAMDKLKSGLAGQVESLRQLGIDVSESSLEGVLASAGMTDTTVQELSYAEKEIARYIAIIQQASAAQGDFAKNFETPANQIRVFKNQLSELKQVAGSFIINAFGQIITYANAAVMVIKEILTALAELFGFEISTSSSSSSITSVVDDVNDGLTSASETASELKKQLMGFDEINNISPPTSSSSSSSGSGTGIDDRLLELLDSLGDWDNMMDSITSKAQELRDTMLEWLGFVRDDDGTWRLGEGLTNFEKILEVVKSIGIAFGTWKVASTITSLLKNLGILGKTQAFQLAFGITLAVTGFYLLYKGTQHLLDGDVDLFTILETIAGGAGTTLGIASIIKALSKGTSITWGQALTIGFGITLAIQGFQVFLDGISTGDVKEIIIGALELTGALSITLSGLFGTSLIKGIKNAWTWITNLGSAINTTTGQVGKHSAALDTATTSSSNWTSKLTGLVAGFAGVATGSYLTYDAMKSLGEESTNTAVAIGELGVGLATSVASGALAGSQFGILGTIIGGLVGLVASVTTGIIGLVSTIGDIDVTLYTEEIQALAEEVDELTSSYESAIDTIESSYEAKEIDAEYAKLLTTQLGAMVDANGKVLDGQEEYVDFILNELNDALDMELELKDGLIYNNGELVDSYSELQSSIYDTIDAMLKEAEAEAYKELYTESVKTLIELENQRTQALEESAKVQEELAKYEEEYNSFQLAWMATFDENYKQLNQDAKDLIDTMQDINEASELAADNMNTAALYMQNSLTETAEVATESVETIATATENISSEMIKAGQVTSEQLQAMLQENQSTWEEIYDELETAQQASMLAQSTTIDEWSPVIEEKWRSMAENSASDFLEALSSVDSDTQAKILSTIDVTEELTPEMTAAWQVLADSSSTSFASALSQVEVDTQAEILASIAQVNGYNSSTATAWANLASSSESAYVKALDSLDTDTKKEIQAAVKAIQNQTSSAEDAGEDVADAVTDGVTSMNTSSIGKNIVTGIASGISGNTAISALTNAAKSLASSIVSKVSSFLGISSPSKVMADLAQYIPLGVAEGINGNIDEATKSAIALAEEVTDAVAENMDIDILKDFSDGIKIDSKDFSIDTNQYVNYGAVKGQIDAQSDISMSDNIISGIAQAVKVAIENTELDVNIEATTEEGVIVKKVSDGFKKYVRQTGELPFPVPV